ncbi:hypothetical protein PROFUN_04826 [Planoprotostelium fungivorum]|uniref:Uncharacterized protein n=1 Tax=Planoprotostelium fungivorum TaxID=1890364 RepID=A0A2P6NT36_9EUKA|nr:hypothetical protein PROFUN_04826 [Planoprotostelium fungivorum]
MVVLSTGTHHLASPPASGLSQHHHIIYFWIKRTSTTNQKNDEWEVAPSHAHLLVFRSDRMEHLRVSIARVEGRVDSSAVSALLKGLYDEGRRVSLEAVVYGVWPYPAQTHWCIYKTLGPGSHWYLLTVRRCYKRNYKGREPADGSRSCRLKSTFSTYKLRTTTTFNMDKKGTDNRSNQMNPNHSSSKGSGQKEGGSMGGMSGMGGSGQHDKMAQDNRSNQMNPNHSSSKGSGQKD